MEGSKIFVLLLAYILIREVFFYYQLNKLINKLMSRNYAEYRLSENPGKIETHGIKVDEGEPEDLGIFQGIG